MRRTSEGAPRANPGLAPGGGGGGKCPKTLRGMPLTTTPTHPQYGRRIASTGFGYE